MSDPDSTALPAANARSPTAAPNCASPPLQPATWGWLIALVAWTALISFYDLGGGGGLEPVEAWVAQPAREMYDNIAAMFENIEESGWQWRPFVLPEFCGETRMQKSPGAYWAVCLTSYLRGAEVDEVSARMPNAVAAVLMVVTIFWLTRRIAGDRAAIFAGFAASSSAMLLYWSHGAASDLGVATLITMSLACLWVACEDEPPGWKRHTLWLAGYLFAGLAMIYKMPLPLPCIGIPALLYVLLRGRWRIFASWWHLLGLLLFLLPWLPWALAAMHYEDMAIHKWRVEFFDRVTGDLPNVEAQKQWFWYLFYVGVALLLAVPYSLSLPAAVARPFRRTAGLNRDGLYFALLWFVGLLVFFTLATGKETRYFLPAMPPLFVLLGVELSAFFDPIRLPRANLANVGLAAVCVLVPSGLIALGYWLHGALWEKHLSQGMFTWDEVWQPYAVAAALFAAGTILAAWLYRLRRESAAFAALVGTMWIAWAWAWANLMPVLASQAPFKDFAAQLKSLAPEYQARLRQVAHQDPRYIWYSDVRFPRVIDQLELLEAVGGRRDLQREMEIVGREIVHQLESDELALLVTSPEHYILLQTDARVQLEREGRELPRTYVWLQARKGHPMRRYLLISNRPPPWQQPELPDEIRSRMEKRLAKLRAADAEGTPPASGVSTSLPTVVPRSRPVTEP